MLHTLSSFAENPEFHQPRKPVSVVRETRIVLGFGVGPRSAEGRQARWRKKVLDMDFDFKPVAAGPKMYMSPHDFVLMDMAIFEAGLDAEKDGYDAVCIDSMSDSGVDALRSVLKIPVIAPGKASMLFALALGNRFALLSQWEYAQQRTVKFVRSLGLEPFCAAVENYDVPPDYVNLMTGKEDVTFPKMQAAAKVAKG